MSDNILVVDDDDSLRRMMEYTLQQAGYKVRVAGDGDEALAAVRKEPPRLIVTDLKMERMGGFELLTHVRQDYPEILVVMVTAFGSVESAVEAMQLGAHDYLVKPFSREALCLAVQRALSYGGLQRENKELRKKIAQGESFELITAAPVMQNLIATLDRVATSDVPVLLTGESGSGKELLARRVHEKSARAGQPFIALNCAAIPQGLIESELFGHLKGSFTGALKDRKGKFEQANGGTLFLDEIGELPIDQQPKLLRTLQLGEIEPIGGQTCSVDVRVVAATNLNLEDEIRQGNFREDLYYRLAVIPLEVPPLRQRREEVPLLARHFLRQYSAERQLGIKDDVIIALQQYSWPGNVRELKNLMQRLAILCDGDSVDMIDLSANLLADSASINRSGLSGLSGDSVKTTSPFVLPTTGYPLEELEKSAIRQALQLSSGNQTRAAELLHIPRHVLLYRLEKFGLKSP
ncbi:sigma-54-dependent transcriptional regulator [Pelovirga terrestris]|uniref:Sigma-54-dependent Fis family transcriptional regulator n=1 Tax=Pelovirga terrestris TaxID=2771352 RepID=A0A8J6QUN4_9BACT|nr:sigma-54 dependent transcriptional regulator [Pelovirga terrestris]MBD1400505.1 sigma-54-dependent Fis family transcriptional regulator [Pelovirga terrestris]